MSRFAEHTQFLSALNFFVEKFNYVDTEINNCNCDGTEVKCKVMWFIRSVYYSNLILHCYTLNVNIGKIH